MKANVNENEKITLNEASSVKDFLGQAVFLDRLIDTKVEQLEQVKKLCPAQSASAEAGALEKKLRLMEKEIDDDIDNYIDLKQSIAEIIRSVPDLRQRLILEQHYLLFRTWDDIADRFFMSERNVQYLHKKAIQNIERNFL